MLKWVMLYGFLAPIIFILTSWQIIKSEKQERILFRLIIIITGIFFLGGMVLVLPFIPQPRIENIFLQYLLGIPLAVAGIILRIYPLLYFKKKGTRSDLLKPGKLVTDGPYSIIRHPQYVAGVIFIIGWFLIWGGLYSFYLIPVIAIVIFLQALIEEKYILEVEFGIEYQEYQKKVGMFLPKIRK